MYFIGIVARLTASDGSEPMLNSTKFKIKIPNALRFYLHIQNI